MRNGDNGWNPLFEEGLTDFIESYQKEKVARSKCTQCGSSYSPGAVPCCLYNTFQRKTALVK